MDDAANTGNTAGVTAMTEQGGSADPVPAAGEDMAGQGERRFEFTTALVLAAAGLASAWASFQGGLWDKLESEQFASANAHLTESSQLMIRSGQEQAVSAALFLQWLDATSDRQETRAKVIEGHMPAWFAGEFAAWRARLPKDLKSVAPNAQLPRFHGPSLGKAVMARKESDAARAEARRAGDNGDTYDIANVVLAVALFLAGITSVLHSRRGKHMVMALAGALTLAAVVAMLMAPSMLP